MIRTVQNSEKIRRYYREFNPWLPERPGWYHFRVRCLDGGWKKLRRINSPEKLKKELIWSDAGDVYFSAAKWLNPEKISHKEKSGMPGYSIADKLYLGSDLVFDVDAHNSSLEDARKNALKLYYYMKRLGLKNQYILFTGGGFHLSYSYDEKISKDALCRLGKSEKNRKRFKYRMPKNICFDAPTLINPLLIRRLPGTVHIRTGIISTIINIKTLRKPIKELMNNIPRLYGRPGKPLKRLMTKSLVSSKKVLAGAAGLAPQNTILFTKNYVNKVSGTKNRYTLMLKYGWLQKYWEDVKYLQRRYKLGKVHVLEGEEINKNLMVEKRIWVISCQTNTHERLLKMIKRTRALNKNQQGRIRRTLMPIQEYVYKETIKSANKINAASKSHRRLIKILTGKIDRAKHLEGNDKIKIWAHIKKR